MRPRQAYMMQEVAVLVGTNGENEQSRIQKTGREGDGEWCCREWHSEREYRGGQEGVGQGHLKHAYNIGIECCKGSGVSIQQHGRKSRTIGRAQRGATVRQTREREYSYDDKKVEGTQKNERGWHTFRLCWHSSQMCSCATTRRHRIQQTMIHGRQTERCLSA